MHNSDETFYISLQTFYQKKIFKDYMDSNKIEVERILNDFKRLDNTTDLDFLNVIPLKDREPALKSILEWIINYTLEPLPDTKDKKASVEINSISQKLDNVKGILEEYLKPYIDIETILKGKNYSYSTTYDDSKIKETVILLNELILDMQNAKKTHSFKYFPSNFFYIEKRATKEQLIRILTYLTNQYNIKKQSRHIKDFVDSLS